MHLSVTKCRRYGHIEKGGPRKYRWRGNFFQQVFGKNTPCGVARAEEHDERGFVGIHAVAMVVDLFGRFAFGVAKMMGQFPGQRSLDNSLL